MLKRPPTAGRLGTALLAKRDIIETGARARVPAWARLDGRAGIRANRAPADRYLRDRRVVMRKILLYAIRQPGCTFKMAEIMKPHKHRSKTYGSNDSLKLVSHVTARDIVIKVLAEQLHWLEIVEPGSPNVRYRLIPKAIDFMDAWRKNHEGRLFGAEDEGFRLDALLEEDLRHGQPKKRGAEQGIRAPGAGQYERTVKALRSLGETTPELLALNAGHGETPKTALERLRQMAAAGIAREVKPGIFREAQLTQEPQRQLGIIGGPVAKRNIAQKK